MSAPVIARRREDRLAMNLPFIFGGISLAYAPVGLIETPATLPILYVNVIAAILWGMLGMFARRGSLEAVRWLMFVVVAGQISSQCLVYGPDPLTHLFLITGLPAAFLIFPAEQKRRMYFLVVFIIAVVIALELGTNPSRRISNATLRAIRSTNVVGILSVIVGLSFQSYRVITRTEEDLAREHDKSERLLLNILPAPIAARLKEQRGPIAERFECATILFADIVSFTPLAQRIPAAAVVSMLDEIFREFDALAHAHGVEKIKTIGDAYMAAAGIPEPCADHAQRVADMALQMQSTIAEHFGKRYPELTLRIGIAAGPVVAGVIGERKFSYDLWGDAVNTASRMESHGVPGRIQVNEKVRELLGDAYRFESRGMIDIKGKGPMEVFLLEGRES